MLRRDKVMINVYWYYFYWLYKFDTTILIFPQHYSSVDWMCWAQKRVCYKGFSMLAVTCPSGQCALAGTPSPTRPGESATLSWTLCLTQCSSIISWLTPPLLLTISRWVVWINFHITILPHIWQTSLKISLHIWNWEIWGKLSSTESSCNFTMFLSSCPKEGSFFLGPSDILGNLPLPA